MLSPRPSIRTLPLYHPPLAGRNGLRLDFNENTVGCSPRVLERLRQLGPEDFARYPEREPVEAKVAAFLGVPPAQLLLTNGVDEAIHLLCQTYLDPGDEALIVVPTYSMYRIYILAAGAQLVNVPCGEGFAFPASELRDHISPRTRLIAVANPNNPTGRVARREELLEIARSAPDAAVLIDEAYFEFYGETQIRDCAEAKNLFVARTFSKAYGMAGMRLGVLVGPAEQMTAVRRASSPYNVNAVALACLPEALQDQAYIEQYVSEVLESRGRLEQALELAGIPFCPSNANFVLLRAGATKDAAAAFVEQMRSQGILVRDRSNDYGCEGWVRITLGPRDHADRLLASLQVVTDHLGIVQGAIRR
ncbi:MAG TPA: histidinol-phosphate transaminase [Candidatus Sulfotelmatobacter sp.]|nr:histidinol-phosphate transaminase [Candidatus Sulfotelmatobacter sp.]